MSIKRLFQLFILMAATLSVRGEQNIEWADTVHDFGAIEENDGPVTCDLRFVNRGESPVAVVTARASCGCTTPKYLTAPVAPGDTGVVEVTFDPTGRPGRFNKNVRVETSDGHGDLLRSSLRIKGVVVGASNTVRSRYPIDAGAVRLCVSTAVFGEVLKTRDKVCYIECYNSSRDTVIPYWDNLPPYITARSLGSKVAPGEQKTFTLYFSGPKAPLYGIVTDSLAFYADKGAAPVTIDAVAMVKEDFSRLTPGARANSPEVKIEPEIVDFGKLDSQSPSVSRTFEIVNRGHDHLLVRRVYTTDRGVSVSIDREKVKRNKRAVVTVTVTPSQLPSELLNARISVITNDPLRPTVVVRAVGER